MTQPAGDARLPPSCGRRERGDPRVIPARATAGLACSQSRCVTRLRHAPTEPKIIRKRSPQRQTPVASLGAAPGGLAPGLILEHASGRLTGASVPRARCAAVPGGLIYVA